MHVFEYYGIVLKKKKVVSILNFYDYIMQVKSVIQTHFSAEDPRKKSSKYLGNAEFYDKYDGRKIFGAREFPRARR